MKIAIASEKDDVDGKVSETCARAAYFIMFENKEQIKTIKNPFKVGGGGAGFSVAKVMEDEGVNLIICGRIGSNMKGALTERNIKYKELENTSIKEALETIR